MARLPQSIDAPAPQGQRPSTAAPRATDFGLGDLAQGVEKFAQAQKVQDENWADDQVRQHQATTEPEFAERAAKYDGRQPGFATAEIGAFDAAWKPMLDRADVPPGKMLALRQRIDALRGNTGQRAIALEAQKRGGIIADQEEVTLAHRVNEQVIAFSGKFGAHYQELADGFDGSQPDFSGRVVARYDEDMAAQVASAPEDIQTKLQSVLEAKRVQYHARALDAQDEGHTAFVMTAAKSAAQELVNTVQTNPALYDTVGDDIERSSAALPAALKGPYEQELWGKVAQARLEGLMIRGDLTQVKSELESGRFDKVLPPSVKMQLTQGVRREAAIRAGNLIEAAGYGADVNPEEMAANAAASGDPSLVAKVDWTLAVGAGEPAALASLADGKKSGFASWAAFTIDKVEGSAFVADDNGKGPTKFGINQTANPDLDVPGLTRLQAVARYRKYWAAVGGDRLPAPLAIMAADAAVNQGPAQAKQWLAQSGGDVQEYRALREAHYRALAKDPDQAKNLKGWLSRLNTVSSEAAQAQSVLNVQDGLSKDPIEFALRHSGQAGFPAVPPLPQGPQDPAWGAALQGRLRAGQQMSATYRTPVRLLTSGEATYLRDQVEHDPMVGLQIAETARAALGPARAIDLIGELGQKDSASVQVYIAGLHASGQDRFAASAVKGLALRAQKVELDKADRDEISAEVKKLAPLFVGQPEPLRVIQATAEAAALAQGQSGNALTAQANVNSALGASSRGGRIYGGVATYNGAQTLLPPWLAQDHLDDVMDHLAQGWEITKKGPTYPNGTPMPADRIAKLRLVRLPNEHYRLMTRDGEAARGPDGRVFEINLDAAAKRLRARFGSAVLAEGW